MIRFVATVLLLALTGLYVALHPPTDYALGGNILASCPLLLDDWNGAELSFEDAVIEELRADEILVRRYQRNDQRVWLCIVYHQRRRYGAHDPKLCYESQGYLVERVEPARIQDGSAEGLVVNRFVAQSRRERRLVYYWWNAEGLATSDVAKFRQRLALKGALGAPAWGAFVRVETIVHATDEDAERVVRDFASSVARSLPSILSRAPRTGA
ncbi:MAG: EpsI family protein [Candidatus Eisenbacteria bacterium]|uniref:EpsI family protein n=1 Tax=Eiseniibacteriota bacterium TaxID=2212470 RepID=A0A849SGU2_UNCEI|nr:EpsI family protein [Candidatus Eisenbacteria bacterium]